MSFAKKRVKELEKELEGIKSGLQEYLVIIQEVWNHPVVVLATSKEEAVEFSKCKDKRIEQLHDYDVEDDCGNFLRPDPKFKEYYSHTRLNHVEWYTELK